MTFTTKSDLDENRRTDLHTTQPSGLKLEPFPSRQGNQIREIKKICYSPRFLIAQDVIFLVASKFDDQTPQRKKCATIMVTLEYTFSEKSSVPMNKLQRT